MAVEEAIGHANGSGLALAVGETNTRSIMDRPGMAGETTLAWNLGDALEQTSLYRDAILLGLPVTLSQTIGVDPVPDGLILLGGLIQETITFLEESTEVLRYTDLIAELTSWADALTSAYAMTLAETIEVALALTGVWALLVMEQLHIAPLLTPESLYRLVMADTVLLSDAASRFFGGEVAETYGITETLIDYALFPHVLTETIGVAGEMTEQLIFRVTASDSIVLDDADLIKMIFAPTLTDEVVISAAYISPNNTLTSWAVNTRTGAVTEYTNFSFNSFAQAGHKYLGASSTGLYELNGSTDDGTDIIARLRSGFSQFGGSRFSSFKAAYVGMRSSGTIIFRLISGDDKTYTYQVIARSMQTTKVKTGKGLRSKFFAFELESTGQDFDLDSIELVPLVAQRRV